MPQEGIEKALVYGAVAVQRADLLEQAREILVPYFASPLFAKLRAMHSVAAEMPFARQLPEGVLRGVMDLPEFMSGLKGCGERGVCDLRSKSL